MNLVVQSYAADLDALSRTIYGEARGEDIVGKIAVANVVLNRVKKIKAIRAANPQLKSHLFGNGTVENACLRPYQFSCWNVSDPNRDKILKVKPQDLHFAECIAVAKMAIAGLLIDNTEGATHYHVTSMGFPPAWLHKGELPHKPCVIIGKHSFYNTVK